MTSPDSAGADRQVRVFISSTFRDMHAERDHLVTVVFPELRERVERLGLEFFDVDLRWGVPAKDANGETANSWEYCRKWIDRVEPFFVCMLGQRYGYRPAPHDLRDAAEQARQRAQRRSITDLEVRHAVLNERRKRRSYFYLRDTRLPVSGPGADELSTYGEFVDPPEELALLEALKAGIRASGRPVRGYPCTWRGNGFTNLEEFGRLVLDDLWSGVLRDERYVSTDVWRQVLGVDPDTDPRYFDESQPVPRELWEQLVALARPAPAMPLDLERQQMDAFAASRLRWFQGRTRELAELTAFLQSTAEDAPRLAVVAAVPGQGKSALLARLVTLIDHSSHCLFTHFVGATERSASAYALVARLLDELDRSGIAWPADEKKDGEEPRRGFNSLCLRLAQRLGDYAGERRIVILLDALNQLSDGHDLHWLPTRLGPGVRLVVSSVEDACAEADSPEQRVLRALESRQPAPLRVSLGPLTEEDVRTIVVAYLQEYCKELDREHVDALCDLPQARNPLYLLVTLGELRTLGGNEMNLVVPALIASLPQDHPDTVGLFRWVLQRLEVFNENAPDAVQWWCLYLVHGRIGMASHELADLLARKLGADAAATALRIERGLRRYLLRRGGQLDFFHGQLRQAVLERYGPQVEAAAVHYELADYFTDRARGSDTQTEWETDSVRGFAECVFHAIEAGQHDEAAGLLGSFPFLLHKLRVGLLEGVLDDFDMFLRVAPPEAAKRLEVWADFFQERAHILRRGCDEWPAQKILLQLAVEHADDSSLSHCAEEWLAANRCDWFWLRRVPRPRNARKNPCVAVLEKHTDTILGALQLAGGNLISWAGDNTLRSWEFPNCRSLVVMQGHTDTVHGVRELSDGVLLSWSRDKTLRLWNGRTGECTMVLQGHTGNIEGTTELEDGRILSWSWDRTLRLWDRHSGTCLNILRATAEVSGALALSTGRLLSWGGGSVQMWDCQNGECLKSLDGLGATELSDGRLLTWAFDGTLRVWDSHGGACLKLEGHTRFVRGGMELPDGRIVSWSRDMTLRVWDASNGACLAILQGHKDEVGGVVSLADGRLLSWPHANHPSQDHALRLWDGNTGACLATLEGHTREITGALALSDARLLSWGADDELRLWDGHTGRAAATLAGHGGKITGATELPGGLLLSWSSDGTLRLWDTQHGGSVEIQQGHSDYINGAAAGAHNRFFSWTVYPFSGELHLWDSENGQHIQRLYGHTGDLHNVLMLSSGRLLSWAQDNALRIWDGQDGTCLAILQGHTWFITGAVELSDRRLLSWSCDRTLRVWDVRSGEALATLGGHTDEVDGAFELSDGRVLSWSRDTTARIWDSRTGACVGTLGHRDEVVGVLELTDGRLLSWTRGYTRPAGSSRNGALRLWDSRTGQCLAELKGHEDAHGVYGVVELSDGRLLSWSGDDTLRLWDRQIGACVAVCRGRFGTVRGAVELSDGRVLLWSNGGSQVLWAAQEGGCLEAVPTQALDERYPEAALSYAKVTHPHCVSGGFSVRASTRGAMLRHTILNVDVSRWNAETDTTTRCLLPDGTIIVSLRSQTGVLKLHHGQRRVSLAEAEMLITRSRAVP